MTNDGVHLEDCQTNVFALTELTGLKWRFYVTPPDFTSSQSADPFDPIDQAYGRCLNKGHLCTWRRNGSKKELWVFWYQDADFDSIKELTKALTESSDTNADVIPYETRVIFFKALHAKMEVALRRSGYVNFGKWFANPVELPFLGHRELIAEHMTTFNFHFMVYGENTVAAIMSVQRQRPLSWLTKAHFNKEKQEVILGPWGMKGTLIGKATEPFDKQFEDWQNGFGHLPEVEGLPKMVIVDINGVKTLYPTVFVCVVLDDNLLMKDMEKHYDEEANVRRHLSEWHKVSLISFEEASVVQGNAENEPDMDLRINCSQPGSNCPCEMCRNQREFESKYDLTPAALEPTCSNTPDGFLFQSEQEASTHEPASQDFEDELKAIEEELRAAGGSWHMADNFDGIAIKGLDKVNRDVLAKLNDSDLPEVKKADQTPSPFVDLFESEPPKNNEKKMVVPLKENDGPKLYRTAQEIIDNSEDLLIKRSGEMPSTADPLKLNNNNKAKNPKRKVLRFPMIVTSNMDDMTSDDKTLTLMRVGTDDLSIDMSPASLDDTSEPAYRHELVASGPSTSAAQPPTEAHPPRLFPEVVQPALLSPPVSNEHCEPDVGPANKPPKGPPPPNPITMNALKVRGLAYNIQSSNLRAVFRMNNRYYRADIKRMKTAKQTLEFNNLTDKYLKNLTYAPKSAKVENPLAVDFRKLTTKLESAKKVLPEKELQWYEKEFQLKPAIPRYPQMNRFNQPNRPHHFHPYFNNQRMLGPGQMMPGSMGPLAGPMGSMGPGSMGPGSMGPGPMGPGSMGPAAMGPHGQLNPMMRPHMYHLMQQNNPAQPGGMMPPHWNQLRQAPYMNSPTYNMGAMGQAPNPTTFSPSYGNFPNRPNNYMATPPHRAALPSPSPGPTAIGTPATPGSIQQPHSASTVFSPPPASIPPPSSVAPASVPAVSSVKPAVENVVDSKALSIVVQLQDTVLNVHFDVAFEACPMCGCQGNIFGLDYPYITPVQPTPGKEVTYWSGLYDNKSGIRCSCAFSSIRHRFLCYNAGLFPDDAREATGIAPVVSTTVQWFNADSQKDQWLMNLVRQMSHTTALDITNAQELKVEVDDRKSRFTTSEIEKLEFLAAMRKAFEGGAVNADLLHPWTVEVELKPAKESEWIGQRDDVEAIVNQVKEDIMRGKVLDDYGSMTWKQLSSKLSRKADVSPSRYMAEPIPYILAGVEKEHAHRIPKEQKDQQLAKLEKERLRGEQIFPISISPTAIRYWDRLQLLPYSEPKNIMYIGVVPDDANIERKTRTFLECLSITYENCQLGRHIKFASDELQEGIVRLMNPKVRTKDNRIQCYVESFEQQMMRLLRDNDAVFEKRTFHLAAAKKPPQPQNDQPPAAASPFASALQPSPGNHDMPSIMDVNGMPQMQAPQPKVLNIIEDTYNPEEELELLPHVVVIYVINPFSFGSHKREPQHNRDSTVALLNAFNEVVYNLRPHRRIQLQLQLIDIHKILNLSADLADADGSQPLVSDYIREMAFGIYQQSRQLLAEHASDLVLKSMTAFGLRTRLEAQMPRELREHIYTLPSNPFILSRPSTVNVGSKDEKLAIQNSDEKVMFVTYCLLGQDWLLVAVTDGRGSMVDNGMINLTTRSPNARYTQAKTQILDAMGRLWQYIMGILSQDVKNWRVVINRLGRIGHGELKAWGHLLSKSNLQRYCNTLKDKCKSCNGVARDSPLILSACLVSLEPEAFFRVLPSATKKSPDGVSSTHIMVFPNTSNIQTDPHHNDNDRGIDFDSMDFLEGNVDEDVTEDLISGIGLSDDGQKALGRHQRTDFFNADASDVFINNQPLATGYYISTAPAADLPDWFWSSCRSARSRSPVHLRSSLHLTATNSQSEELTMKQSTECTHPLEASATEDVLRFVLESYNALSWLDINLSTGDRRSCLPNHIQVLLRHYHNLSKVMSPS
ncbi:hypothetical protein QR680_015066 [Steinernema hermaphroditum]|uniref:Mediator of RNA polymerase II transcription subunit 13 n=1 Tax=Steinernema hermaphroditum TaxID=289476 RepID=A0AA39M498_9BILA|nr:hypothetical protein QR680_015066 [Steinernema hermaphroditum]